MVELELEVMSEVTLLFASELEQEGGNAFLL
jgi:hypothetical protein